MNGVSWRRVPRIAADTARVWYQAATYLAATWMPRAVSRLPSTGAPHVLLLARHLPPIVTGGVYRPLALMNEGARRGWKITAVSCPAPSAPSAAGLELRNRFPPSARLVNWKWSTLDVSRRAPNLDGGFTAIRAILDAAQDAMRDEPPDLIHATGPTFSEFVVAMVLARKWGVPFSLDYRDEWSESPFTFVRRGNSDRFWENKVLAHASLVTFTTEAQRDHQLKAFPDLDRRITAVVGNGWDEEAAQSAGAPPNMEAASGRATVAYLGNLSQHCDLPEFLATLRGALDSRPDLKRRIAIDFVGIKADVERRLLSSFDEPEVLRDLPQVPLTTAQAMMRMSRALLLLNPPLLARYIPGKAYEYIATGNRILLYGEGGELDGLLSDYPGAIRVHRGDATGLAEALSVIAGSDGHDRVDPTFVGRYSRLRRSAEHADMLERLISASRGSEVASPPPS